MFINKSKQRLLDNGYKINNKNKKWRVKHENK